jgi:Transport and Golgi organisation 2
MCSIVLLIRPGHHWPVIAAANRDEMRDRPWRPPGRHWPDRPGVVAGLDLLAGGSWLGINSDGVAAAILNRVNALGPAAGFRSRGELVLEALDHPDAAAAAVALADLAPDAYRPFNMVVFDNRDAYWLRNLGPEEGSGVVEVKPIPAGFSMITAHDRNDRASPRIRRFLPRFAAAAPPDPDRGEWNGWTALLGSQDHASTEGPAAAMWIDTETGFGTVSSALIALPRAGLPPRRPVWLFTAGRPGEVPFETVAV